MQKMVETMQDAQTAKVGILLFEGFSNLCLANAVEPLRAANTLSRRRLYDWQFLSLDQGTIRSSSGLPVQAERLSDSGDMLVVMPSYGHKVHDTAQCRRALRRAAANWKVLAGLDTGSWLLAASGLLEGATATSHWDILTELAEAFPSINVSNGRYVIDGKRVSSGGATTTLELMLELIRRAHGATLSLEVAALFMFGERDPATDPRFRQTTHRLVRAAAALMRRELEEPRDIASIARSLGTSRRNLETVFKQTTGQSPSRVYRNIRLAEARRWVEETNQGVAEIAVRCGYADPAAMTRAFKAQHGLTPRDLRARHA